MSSLLPARKKSPELDSNKTLERKNFSNSASIKGRDVKKKESHSLLYKFFYNLSKFFTTLFSSIISSCTTIKNRIWKKVDAENSVNIEISKTAEVGKKINQQPPLTKIDSDVTESTPDQSNQFLNVSVLFDEEEKETNTAQTKAAPNTSQKTHLPVEENKQESQGEDWFSELPDELVDIIGKELPLQDQINLSKVAKKFEFIGNNVGIGFRKELAKIKDAATCTSCKTIRQLICNNDVDLLLKNLDDAEKTQLFNSLPEIFDEDSKELTKMEADNFKKLADFIIKNKELPANTNSADFRNLCILTLTRKFIRNNPLALTSMNEEILNRLITETQRDQATGAGMHFMPVTGNVNTDATLIQIAAYASHYKPEFVDLILNKFNGLFTSPYEIREKEAVQFAKGIWFELGQKVPNISRMQVYAQVIMKWQSKNEKVLKQAIFHQALSGMDRKALQSPEKISLLDAAFQDKEFCQTLKSVINLPSQFRRK